MVTAKLRTSSCGCGQAVGSLLKAADVDVEDGYVSTAEDRPDLYVCEATGNSNDPDIRVAGDERVPYSDRSRLSFTGGFDIGGYLELNATMMNNHFASFMERIYIMHPFVDATDLRKLFEDFLARYGRTSRYSQSGGIHGRSDFGWSSQLRTELFRVPRERSPDDAVVFQVLAQYASIQDHYRQLHLTRRAARWMCLPFPVCLTMSELSKP